jgi:hypothetical protein
MNRDDLEGLALTRLRESKVLLAKGEYSGAYYLAGYVVECGLKACIARQTRRNDFPDKKRAEASWTHSPETLIRAAGLQAILETENRTDPMFSANWDIVRDWKEDSRYVMKGRSQAQDLVREGEVALTWGKERPAVLARTEIPVKAAFWLYLPESSEWRLFIATPLVDEGGPLSAYKALQTRLGLLSPPIDLTLQNLSVISPKDKLVKVFQKVMRRVHDASGVRLTGNVLGGTYIDDAYVYRLA